MLLYLLRTFGKPLALVAVITAIFLAGVDYANRACEAAAMQAANAELIRQLHASKKVSIEARIAVAARLEEFQTLNKKVDDYESQIRVESDRCIISDSDARRLRAIR